MLLYPIKTFTTTMKLKISFIIIYFKKKCLYLYTSSDDLCMISTPYNDAVNLQTLISETACVLIIRAGVHGVCAAD